MYVYNEQQVISFTDVAVQGRIGSAQVPGGHLTHVGRRLAKGAMMTTRRWALNSLGPDVEWGAEGLSFGLVIVSGSNMPMLA